MNNKKLKRCSILLKSEKSKELWGINVLPTKLRKNLNDKYDPVLGRIWENKHSYPVHMSINWSGSSGEQFCNDSNI